MEPQKEKKKKRRDSRISIRMLVISRIQCRIEAAIGSDCALSLSLELPRARWSRDSCWPCGMCQRRIPLFLPSRYLRNADDATRDFMCAAPRFTIVFRDAAAKRLFKRLSGPREEPIKMTKRGEKRKGRASNCDGVSNNASFMVLCCCVRKQIIECGERERGPGCGIKFARVRPRVTNLGGGEKERERDRERSVEFETGIELCRSS